MTAPLVGSPFGLSSLTTASSFYRESNEKRSGYGNRPVHRQSQWTEPWLRRIHDTRPDSRPVKAGTAPRVGLEPTTSPKPETCSVQLSYRGAGNKLLGAVEAGQQPNVT